MRGRAVTLTRRLRERLDESLFLPPGMTMTITCDHLESATGPAPAG
jgi:hypothetical protein